MNFLLPSPVSQPLPHLASSQLLSLLGKVPCQGLGTELFLFPGHPSPQCLPALPSLVMCLLKCQFLRPLLLPSINSNPLLIFISLTCFIFPITLIIWMFVLVWFPHWKICSVAKSCLTLCTTVDCSMPGSSVLHFLPVFVQIQVHWVRDAI